MEVVVVTLASELPNDNPRLHAGVRWLCPSTTGPAVPEGPEPASLPAVLAADEAPAAPGDLLGVARGDEPMLADGPSPLRDEEGALVEPPPPRESGFFAVVSGALGSFSTVDALAALGEGEAEPVVVEELEPLGDQVSVEGVTPVAESVPALVAEAVEEAGAVGPAVPLATPPPQDEPFRVLVGTLVGVAVDSGAPAAAAWLPALLERGTLSPLVPADALAALVDGRVVVDGAVSEAFESTRLAWRAILCGTSEDFGACGSAMLDEWAADVLARAMGAPARVSELRRELRARGVAAFGLASAA